MNDMIPAPLLFGWRAIFEVLGMEDTPDERRRLRARNFRHDGPIILDPEKRGSPLVNRDKLLDWWKTTRDI